MKKKAAAILLTACLVISAAACGNTGNNTSAADNTGGTSHSTAAGQETKANETASGTEAASSAESTVTENDYFSNSDLKDVTTETPNAEITLSGSAGTISDTTRGSSGETVTITSKGIYHVTGSSEDVTILINDETESGNIYLILDGVSMTNSSAPCILVEAADKVIIQLAGENNLTYTASSADEDGAIYAKDDVTINGTGSLTIASALHGIVCKDDVKITGAVVTITAGSIGIKAGDSVRIGGGQFCFRRRSLQEG